MIIEPGDNPIFQKNVDMLRTIFPRFFRQLEKADETEWPCNLLRFEFFEGKSGLPTFSAIAADGRKVHGHSIFDPYKEAEKKYGDMVFGETDRIVVLGFGFGYHIDYLLQNTEKQVLIIIEPFPALFLEALKRVDVTRIFKTGRVIPTISIDASDLSFLMQSGLTPLNLPETKTVGLPYFSLVPTVVDRIQQSIAIMKDHMLFNMMTNLYAGPMFWDNIIQNFRSSYKSPGIDDFKDCFKGKPAFVIAPGPSLERNISQLKRVKGKAAILCADTATRILLKHGITPDLIVTIDYQLENYDKLKNVDTSTSYLCPAVEVCPEIPKNHKGKAIVYYHTGSTAAHYDPILGKKGLIGSGGSVLTDTVNIAATLGAGPIILMGVDLGFPGMRWYADGSFDGGEFTRALRDGEIETLQIPDVYGNPMVTYKSFFAFLNYFEMVFQRFDMTVVDATEGGALIKGTRVMTAADAIDEYLGEGYDPMAILDEIHARFEPPSKDQVIKKIDKMLDKYIRLRNVTSRGLRNVNKALGMMDKMETKKTQFVDTLKKVQNTKLVLKKMEKEMDFITPLIERSMISIFHHDNKELEDSSKSISEKKNAYKEVIELDLGLYTNVNMATKMFIEHFEKIRGELQDENNADVKRGGARDKEKQRS